jgi:hypothetical protein
MLSTPFFFGGLTPTTFKKSKLSISLIEPLFFLRIELSIYWLSNQLTWENNRFIDIDPWNLIIEPTIIDLQKNDRVPTSA